MKFLEDIEEDTLIVCSNRNKKLLLRKMSSLKKLINVIFLNKEEFFKLFYFSYDEKTIYYLIKKYNIKYDIAVMYLKYLIYLDKDCYSNYKLNKLFSIKKELDDNNLLIYDKYFFDYIKNKNIIIYGYEIDKFFSKTISKFDNVKYINNKSNQYNHDVFAFSHINDEIEFVCQKICELISNGVNINNIKLTNVNDEYNLVIKRIFNLYGIPIDLGDDIPLYYTLPSSYFLKNYASDLHSVIEEMKNVFNIDIVNQIISIINKYTFVNDKLLVKDMIIHDLMNTKVKKFKFNNKVEVIDIFDVCDEDYVFLIGFNQNSIPVIYKDEEYLSNKELETIGLETSNEKNISYKNRIINIIKSIKNLYISYKDKSYNNVFYPSNLIKELNMNVISIKNNYKFSNKYNKLKLCKMLDEYYKYNIKSDDFDRLYNTYNLDYKNYNNKFIGIDFNDLNKIINNELSLSYSSMQTFNECGFKYYINNILKLDVYEDKFSSFVGTLFHHILEIGLLNDINVKDEVYKFLRDRSLNNKEKFYINKLISDIEFAVNVIKDKMKFTKFNEYNFENKLSVIKNGNIKVIFKGFIDKMMSYEYNGKRLIALVDYKTYDVDVKMDLIDYGLNIQLPIYLYLANNSFPDALFAGFYVQKILPSDNKYDCDKTLSDRKSESMKLSGYSNSDENILELFDSSYRDSSVIKGLKFNKDGNFSSSSCVFSNSQMNEIVEKVDMQINNCVQKIENCDFDINPKKYKDVNISCKYCKYNDICFKCERDIVNIKEEE